MLTTTQDTEVVRGLVGGGTAIQAGIRYLESASLEFVAKTGGRSWKVYGSPVRSLAAVVSHSLTPSRLVLGIVVVHFSIMMKMPKVRYTSPRQP
jgi:hypothetical protein